MRGAIYPLALGLRLVTLLIVSIVAGVIVGHLVDRYLHVAPCGLFCFTVLGLLVATRGIYTAVSSTSKTIRR